MSVDSAIPSVAIPVLPAAPFQTAQRLLALAQQASAGQPQTTAELQRAAQMFEATFVTWLLREMRQTVPQGGLLPSGPAQETYDQMLDEAMGNRVASGQGIGLAQLLRAQLQRYLAPAQATQPAAATSSTSSTGTDSSATTIGGRR